MVLAAVVVERAMKMQEIILRALSGVLTWLQAAETAQAVMTALADVVRTSGPPLALYTDRAGWPSTRRRSAARSIAITSRNRPRRL